MPQRWTTLPHASVAQQGKLSPAQQQLTSVHTPRSNRRAGYDSTSKARRQQHPTAQPPPQHPASSLRACVEELDRRLFTYTRLIISRIKFEQREMVWNHAVESCHRILHKRCTAAVQFTLTPFLAHNCDNGVPTTALTVFLELVNSTTTFACKTRDDTKKNTTTKSTNRCEMDQSACKS